MKYECSYCKTEFEGNGVNCPNCGAPVERIEPATNFRLCPFCGRKLLALASPACSYCGRRLPEQFIKARTEDLHRIGEIGDLATSSKEGRASGLDSDPDAGTLVDVVAGLIDVFR